MLSRLIPREGRFFDLFRKSAETILESALEFKDLLTDLPHAEERARKLKEIEHRADDITHATIEMLHTTFITPMDRDDIHRLISKMDDIVDLIEACSQRIFLYGVTKLNSETTQLAELIVESARLIQTAVGRLENLKEPTIIKKTCVEINRLENEADHVLRNAIAKLFRDEKDTRELIKLKEICELLETVTDRCEDVANIIEGIVLEYA